VTDDELRNDVEDALAPTAGRHEAEQLRVANDAALQRLQQGGYTISSGDITNLHVAVLLDTLFGDLDDPRRQAYEVAVHTKLAGLLSDITSQVARAKLLEGVQVKHNPSPNGPPQGRFKR
jgi:hypothetical protein